VITGIHIDQRGFDINDPEDDNLAILDVETNLDISYSIEAIFDIDPRDWTLAYTFVHITDPLTGKYTEELQVETPLGHFEHYPQLIEELLNAPVLSWVWE
jgi:hypothetical protein